MTVYNNFFSSSDCFGNENDAAHCTPTIEKLEIEKLSASSYKVLILFTMLISLCVCVDRCQIVWNKSHSHFFISHHSMQNSTKYTLSYLSICKNTCNKCSRIKLCSFVLESLFVLYQSQQETEKLQDFLENSVKASKKWLFPIDVLRLCMRKELSTIDHDSIIRNLSTTTLKYCIQHIRCR